jgi:hypothetical protein
MTSTVYVSGALPARLHVLDYFIEIGFFISQIRERLSYLSSESIRALLNCGRTGWDSQVGPRGRPKPTPFS